MRRLRNKGVLIAIMLWLALVPALAKKIDGVGAISMTVADMDRSVRFYSQVLGFDQISDTRSQGASIPARVVNMRLGDESVELVQFTHPGRPIPVDSRSNDHWFQHVAIIVSDMDRAYRQLRAYHVHELSVGGPQRLPDWNKNAAGIRAFYFADPDSHPLEVLQFPAAKGAEKWHRTDRLFLGIDHTAIVVSDIDQSLRFYRDVLGLSVTGTSENFGPEQEKLNNVAGAHLRITTLRANSGPGIELLEYLAPRNGRDLPFTPRPSDLVHRHTTLITTDLETLGRSVESKRPAQTSLMPVSKHPSEASGMFIDDPDGHELFIRMK